MRALKPPGVEPSRIEPDRRGHRQRPRIEVERDLLAALTRCGAMAAATRMTLVPPDVGEVENIVAGMGRCLVELRAVQEVTNGTS